jgi:hypothetical protein
LARSRWGFSTAYCWNAGGARTGPYIYA